MGQSNITELVMTDDVVGSGNEAVNVGGPAPIHGANERTGRRNSFGRGALSLALEPRLKTFQPRRRVTRPLHRREHSRGLPLHFGHRD